MSVDFGWHELQLAWLAVLYLVAHSRARRWRRVAELREARAAIKSFARLFPGRCMVCSFRRAAEDRGYLTVRGRPHFCPENPNPFVLCEICNGNPEPGAHVCPTK